MPEIHPLRAFARCRMMVINAKKVLENHW